MGIRLEKPWQRLDAETIDGVAAQLGVYHVADAEGVVMSVGYAGATEPFGMRSALRREMAHHLGAATQFRYEFNSSYRSRWDELLMLHVADYGELPASQRNEARRVGQLKPAASTQLT